MNVVWVCVCSMEGIWLRWQMGVGDDSSQMRDDGHNKKCFINKCLVMFNEQMLALWGWVVLCGLMVWWTEETWRWWWMLRVRILVWLLHVLVLEPCCFSFAFIKSGGWEVELTTLYFFIKTTHITTQYYHWQQQQQHLSLWIQPVFSVWNLESPSPLWHHQTSCYIILHLLAGVGWCRHAVLCLMSKKVKLQHFTSPPQPYSPMTTWYYWCY